MTLFFVSRIVGRTRPHGLALPILFLALSSALVLAADKEKKTKSTPTPAPTSSANQKPTATPKPAPTPETKIDARTEAELLQAEGRFIIAIQNRDVKELEELLHPYYADAIEGSERAIRKPGIIAQAAAGRLPAYPVEKERKLTRSGDTFNVEGMGTNQNRDAGHDTPIEWVRIRRVWSREGGRWIATAQIIAPEKEREAEEKKHDPEEKEKEHK